jgi:hypothetical protein
VKTSPLGCSPTWNEDDLQPGESAKFPGDAVTKKTYLLSWWSEPSEATVEATLRRLNSSVMEENLVHVSEWNRQAAMIAWGELTGHEEGSRPGSQQTDGRQLQKQKKKNRQQLGFPWNQ